MQPCDGAAHQLWPDQMRQPLAPASPWSAPLVRAEIYCFRKNTCQAPSKVFLVVAAGSVTPMDPVRMVERWPMAAAWRRRSRSTDSCTACSCSMGAAEGGGVGVGVGLLSKKHMWLSMRNRQRGAIIAPFCSEKSSGLKRIVFCRCGRGASQAWVYVCQARRYRKREGQRQGVGLVW